MSIKLHLASVKTIPLDMKEGEDVFPFFLVIYFNSSQNDLPCCLSMTASFPPPPFQ